MNVQKKSAKKSQPKASKPDPNQKTNELLQLILDEISVVADRLVKNAQPEEDSPDTPDEAA